VKFLPLLVMMLAVLRLSGGALEMLSVFVMKVVLMELVLSFLVHKQPVR
jgi:hypothetical protein